MKKLSVGMLILSCMLFTVGASVWEGAAVSAGAGELPDTGLYAATNSFPRNTVVDVVNLETGKTVRVIVVKGLESPGLLALLSKEAAEAVGMQSRTMGRIRMTMPADPIAFSRFTEGRSSSGDPDHDSAAAVAAAAAPVAAAVAAPSAAAPAPAPVPVPPSAAPAPAGAEEPAIPAPALSAAFVASADGAVQEAAEEDALEISEAEIQEDEPVESPLLADAGSELDSEEDIVDFDGAAFAAAEEIPAEEAPAYTPAEAELPEDGAVAAEPLPALASPLATPMPAPAAEPPAAPQSAGAEVELTLVPAEARPPAAAPEAVLPAEAELPALPPPGPAPAAPLVLPEALFVPPIAEAPEKAPAARPAPPASSAPPQATAPQTAAVPAPAPRAPAVFSAPMVRSLEKGKYYLQLGAFGNGTAVETELKKIGSNFPLLVQRAGSEDKPVYRILVGPVNLGESAALLQRFKRSGYPDAFIRQEG